MGKIYIGPSAFDTLGFSDQDAEDLIGLADARGGWWVDKASFILQLKDKIEAELSFKQTSWAIDIKEKLEDLRRRGRL